LLRQYGQKELNKNICQEKNTGTSGAAHAKTGLKRFRPPLPCCRLRRLAADHPAPSEVAPADLPR